MIKQEKRGFAMSMFTLGVLVGPIIGPVAGGFLAASKGWRWVFWVTSMMLGLISLLSMIFWKESYAPVLLGRKAAKLRTETGNLALRSEYDTGLSPKDHFKRGIGRAIKILVFSPVILSLSIHMGLAYAYFYILFTTFTPVFQDNYNFSSSTVGLSFLGVGIGFVIGQIACAKLGDAIMIKMAEKGDGEMKPEYRLPLCCIGGLFVPVGLLWYGWSVQGGVHWIMPIIGTGILGFGNALIFVSF
jgi:predicted MFS family arabinose efflux permease